MRQIVFLLALLLSIFTGGLTQAQQGTWVQIEARPTLAQAQERARAYSAAFSDVAGFQMTSGWYAIVLGPYTPDAALARLAQLRGDNLIPSDSFIAGGEAFRQPFWPVGQNPATAPVMPLPEAIAVAPPAEPQAPATTPAAEAAPAPQAIILPDETPAEARRSEAQLSRDDRMALQQALQSFGFYAAAIDGAFGPGTRGSMAAWQSANGYEPTGIMTTRQREQIFAEQARIAAELGLQTITEPEAGIEITLPLALVEFDHYEPPFVHYSAKNGSDIRAILISEPGDTATLFGLYDVLQTLEVVPPTGERSRGDRSFSIEASNGQVASYSYAELSQGLIKGYMLIWDPRKPDQAQRALTAMKTSFKPSGRRALDPGLISLDDAQRRGLLAGMEVRRPSVSRSGFYVSAQGDVLTTSEVVQSCTRITLDRMTEADVTYRDDALGLVLLKPRTALAPRHVAGFEATPPRIGTEIAVSGYSYEDALPSPTLTFGALEEITGLAGETGLNRLSIATLPGDAGGPVIDGTGAVLGMLLPRDNDATRVLPTGVAFLATAADITANLAGQNLIPLEATRNGALAPEDLTNLATSMTVLVSCWD